MNVYIIEDPEYGNKRLDGLPVCPKRNVYNTAGQDMEGFCKSMGLDKSPLPVLPAIVFLHGGNPEAAETVPWEEARPSWPEGAEYIAYTTLRVCQSGGRVVVFSGGRPKCDQGALIALLESRRFQLGVHFAFMSLDEINRFHPDLETEGIPASWHVDRIRKSPAIPAEMDALDVLLQRYLKVHFAAILDQGQHRGDTAAESPSAAVSGELLDQVRFSSCTDQRLVPPAAFDDDHAGETGKVGDPGSSWFDECLDDVNKCSFDELVKRCESLTKCSALRQIWEVLRGESLGKPDGKTIAETWKGWSQDHVTRLFALAFVERRAVLLEGMRQRFRHNLLNNRFCHALLQDEDHPEAFVEAYWAEKRNEVADPFQCRNVQLARSEWPNVKANMFYFFEAAPHMHGFRLTKEGDRARNKLKGSAKEIDGFWECLDELADDAALREKRFLSVRNAIKDCSEIFTRAAIRNTAIGQYFGGYLEPATMP